MCRAEGRSDLTRAAKQQELIYLGLHIMLHRKPEARYVYITETIRIEMPNASQNIFLDAEM